MAIRILTTGGTIDKVYFDATSEFEVGEPLIGLILKDCLVTVETAVTSLMRKDSLELTDDDRATVLAAVLGANESQILITHGTDTMTQTAAALLAGDVVAAGKTVCLTGALSPARFRSTDAIFNIGMALAAVQIHRPGVYIAMNGQVFDSTQVRKNTSKNRFEALTRD